MDKYISPVVWNAMRLRFYTQLVQPLCSTEDAFKPHFIKNPMLVFDWFETQLFGQVAFIADDDIQVYEGSTYFRVCIDNKYSYAGTIMPAVAKMPENELHPWDPTRYKRFSTKAAAQQYVEESYVPREGKQLTLNF